MTSPEFISYFADLRRSLDRLPDRPKKGELLERAFEIPLVFPQHEFPPDRSLPDQFKSALATWGGKVRVVRSQSEAVSAMAEIVREAGARKASRWLTPRLDALNLESALADLKLEWIMPSIAEVEGCKNFEERRALRNRLAEIDVGIIDADLAVAHTGTLLLRHTPERNGFTNLFPWTCIAVIHRNQMVKTIQDLADWLGREQAGKPWRPSTIFLTGPSRSGDIDLAVGQGAAGPGQMHVVLIDDEKSVS